MCLTFSLNAGIWHAVVVEKHREEKYAFSGITILRHGNESTKHTFVDREFMLDKFPEHFNVIDNVYDDLDKSK